MTAPDPTAGEVCWLNEDCIAGHHMDDIECRFPSWTDDAASPPAVAASTGTSEDVEGLAKVILAERLAARELPNTYMDDAELVESMKPRARAVLASDWLAAREAAARAEERERITQAIEALAPPAPHTVTPATVGRQATRSALMTAAHIAREGR